jgi:DHA1 family multidrug resistance protein-like MFS transporter
MQSPEHKQRSLFMLMLVQLSTGFSMGIIAPILGLFVRSHGLSMAQIGLVGTASMLGWFIWEPIMGLVADRFNKRMMLAGSLFVTTILYGLYPMADSVLFFAVLEFTKTSVLSAYSIPVKALAAELLPIEDRGRVYGRYMTVISFGGMISPLVGGYVSEVAGFSIPFYLASAIGLLGILAVFSIKYDDHFNDSHINTSDGIRNLLTGSVLAIFSVRGFFFFNAGFTGSFLSIFLNESPQFMASESQIGAFFTVLRLAGAASRSFIGDICDRIGNKPIITGSLAGMGLSYIGLMFTGGLVPMYIIGVVQGLCQASADTSMMLQLIQVMPKERSGLTMGLYSEAENVGGIISTPSVGYLYQNLGANSSIWLVALALLANAGYSYAVIQGEKRES